MKRSPATYAEPDLFADILDGLDVAPTYTITATTDLPARLYGGNAQAVEVSGLDYTLHLDMAKLPESDPTTAPGKWTVVWDEVENTYKRVEFTNLPAGVVPSGAYIGDEPPSSPIEGQLWWESDSGQMFVWYVDANSSQWVPASAVAPSSVVSSVLNNIFDTKVIAELTVLVAGIKSLVLLGYAEIGDAEQMLTCKRVNAMPTTHEGWVRTADRYTANGVVDAVNGGYWEYVYPTEGIRIEWFGGKCDSTTDNLPAYVKAEKMVTSNYAPNFAYYKGGPCIRFGGGRPGVALATYNFSGPITPNRTVHLKGIHSGGTRSNSGNGSVLYFPNGTSGIVIKPYHKTGPGDTEADVTNGAAWTKVEDLCLIGTTGFVGQNGYPQGSTPGIRASTHFWLENLRILAFDGRGIDASADVTTPGESGSNVNLSQMHHLTIIRSNGDGVYMSGGDSNACIGTSIDISNNNGWGINDNSFLGNTWIGCHADSNKTGPYRAVGVNGPTEFIGCYAEGGQGPSYAGPMAAFRGGLHFETGVHTDPGGIWEFGNRHTGGMTYMPPTGKQTGDQTYFSLRGETNVCYTFAKRLPDNNPGFIHEWAWVGSGLWAMRYAGTPSISYAITDDSETYSSGRPGPHKAEPNRFALPSGVFLGGGLASAGGRMFSVGVTIPGSGVAEGGAFAQGERRWNSAPTPGGAEGWVCTQSGFSGATWTNGATYFAPAYAKNAGNWYYMTGLNGIATVPPVHTSGTVTGADGLPWEYLGTGDAVWKTFGMVGALERVNELEDLVATLAARIEALETPT